MTPAEFRRLDAAFRALRAHVRDVHGEEPLPGSASHVEAQHMAAHAREATRWHPDAWRLPDEEDA